MRRIAPVLALVLFASAAVAQNPSCSTFAGGAEGWTAINANCAVVNGVMRCDDRSGPSNLIAPAAFLGNWIDRVAGCGQLCFDINLVRSGVTNAVPLRFAITSGTNRASFQTTPLTTTSGWQTFCAPVSRTSTGQPPPSNVGNWVLGPGTNWNQLIASVTRMDFAIDIAGASVFERIEFDNICFQPGTCPVAEFDWVGGECEGQPIQFRDQSRLATSWLWTFGATGVPASTAPNPLVALPPGTHDVTLCINGGNAAPLCVTHPVTVRRAPSVAPVTGSTNVCGRTTKLCAPFALKTGYQWTGQDVTFTSGTTTRCITVGAAGPSPSVTLTATRTGCSRSTTIPLQDCPTSTSCPNPPFTVRDETFVPDASTATYTSTAVLDIAVPYKSIAMTLISASYAFFNIEHCGDRFPMLAYLDNVQPANGVAPLPAMPFPREAIWPGGAAASVTVTADIKGVPQATLGGCNDQLSFCIKYSVTTDDPSAGCRTCEVVRCSTIDR